MMRERTLLQICMALAACVPVAAGAGGVLLGAGLVPGAVRTASLDSHFAYLSGLLLAVGLGYWSCVPAPERRLGRIGLLTALVALGGLARVLALVRDGGPGLFMQAALVMELGVAPLLWLWARRLPPAPSRTPGALRPRPGQVR